MARDRARSNNSSVPGWGNKSLPPDFLARHHKRGAGQGWWSGLTTSGRGIIAVATLGLVAVVVALALSVSGNTAKNTPAKKHPLVKKPGPVSRPHKDTRLSFPLSKNAAQVNLVFLASGLRLTLESVSATSSSLLKDLTDTYGSPASGTANCFASLDVLADGPEGPPSDGTTGSPGSSIAERYLSRYKKYLDHVTKVRQWALDTPVQAGMREERDRLVRATDDLSRDISVIIAGLERLGAPADEDTGSVVRGLEDSITRIEQAAGRVDQLLKDLGGRP